MSEIDEGQTETPMSDHVARFWHLLNTEYVYISVNIRRDNDEGQPPHWDVSQFGNDVAKALTAALPLSRGEGEHEGELEALNNIRDKLKAGVCGQREIWVEQIGMAIQAIRHPSPDATAIRDAVWCRHSVEVQRGCPLSGYHGGCHYPGCPQDCQGRKNFLNRPDATAIREECAQVEVTPDIANEAAAENDFQCGYVVGFQDCDFRMRAAIRSLHATRPSSDATAIRDFFIVGQREGGHQFVTCPTVPGFSWVLQPGEVIGAEAMAVLLKIVSFYTATAIREECARVVDMMAANHLCAAGPLRSKAVDPASYAHSMAADCADKIAAAIRSLNAGEAPGPKEEGK